MVANLSSLLVPTGALPQPNLSWLGSLTDSLGGAVDELGQRKSFNGLADRIGGAPVSQQQGGGFLSRLMGGNQTQAAQSPMRAPGAPGQRQSLAVGNIDPSIKSGIIQTANSLGVDPVDLATAISYETGGTFDPTKGGPTTQWGQHRGLIQFGEPQAQKYGVNWEDPINSQLGENGAVASYLRDTGVKPGANLLDIYSAINAGGVGRYGASDANNGGAPGTVADKVNGMSAHRQRALALLGNEYASAAPSTATDAVNAMADGSLASSFNGEAPPSPGQQAINQAAPQQGSQQGGNILAAGVTPVTRGSIDPSMIQFMLRDPNLRETGLKLWAANAQGQNPSEAWQFINLPDGTLARANQQTGQVERIGQFSKPQDPIKVTDGETLLDPVTKQPIYAQPKPKFTQLTPEEVKANGLDPSKAYQRGPDNRVYPIGGDGTTVNIDNGTIPPGYRANRDENGRVLSIEPIPGSPAAAAAAVAREQADQRTANTETSANIVTQDIDRAFKVMDGATLPTTGWAGEKLSEVPGTAARDLRGLVDTVKANATFDKLQQMRQASPTGGALGAVSDTENKLLAAAIGNLEQSQSEDQFRDNLARVQNIYLDIIHGPGNGPPRRRLSFEAKPGNAGDIQAAKDAIAKGAPRDAVIKRLRDAGIDPEGL